MFLCSSRTGSACVMLKLKYGKADYIIIQPWIIVWFIFKTLSYIHFLLIKLKLKDITIHFLCLQPPFYWWVHFVLFSSYKFRANLFYDVFHIFKTIIVVFRTRFQLFQLDCTLSFNYLNKIRLYNFNYQRFFIYLFSTIKISKSLA